MEIQNTPTNQPNISFSPQEGITSSLHTLDLDIEDQVLVDYIKERESTSTKFFDVDKKLKTRRAENKKYLFGRQLWDQDIKSYDSEYIDNILYEQERQIKPIALSRLPDLITKAGKETPESKHMAELMTKVVDDYVKSVPVRQILGLAFKHLPVYLTSVIKYRWDPFAGPYGDIVFENIHPNNVLVDHTATKNDAQQMSFIIHYPEKSAKQWAILFPDKSKEILDYLQSKVGQKANIADENVLATKLKISEVWFDFFIKESVAGQENLTPEQLAQQPVNYKFTSGVVFKLGDKILAKSKNPNWDYEGHNDFLVDQMPVDESVIRASIANGTPIPGLEVKKIYNNYFQMPEKPFYFMGYDQWGEQPYDETSRIEQNIPIQKSVDETGRQIDSLVRNAKGKHVFVGVPKKDVEDMDLNDPDEDIVLPGGTDARAVHAYIQPTMPPDQVLLDNRMKRDRAFSKAGVPAILRGEIQSDTATTNQIAREGPYTVADDIVDDTINPAATWIARSLLHMIKLRYTENHLKSIIGDDGKVLFVQLNRDMVEDGMEVQIFASGTDKLKREREAKELIRVGFIDPLSYFQDVGIPDAKGRVERLYLYNKNPELYYKKYIEGMEVPAIAAQVTAEQTAKEQAVTGQPASGTVYQADATSGEPIKPSPENPSATPITPAGSPASPNFMQRAIQGLQGVLKSGGK